MGGKLGTPWERFQTKFRIDKKTGCWNWIASQNRSGYGIFFFPPANMIGAHRAAWKLYKGDPGEMHVLHQCDNRRCVNPAHLRLGTHAENMQERDARGRQYDRNGSNNGRAKLTERQVKAIRKHQGPIHVLATKYGTPASTLKKVRARVTWKHLP